MLPLLHSMKNVTSSTLYFICTTYNISHANTYFFRMTHTHPHTKKKEKEKNIPLTFWPFLPPDVDCRRFLPPTHLIGCNIAGTLHRGTKLLNNNHFVDGDSFILKKRSKKIIFHTKRKLTEPSNSFLHFLRRKFAVGRSNRIALGSAS